MLRRALVLFALLVPGLAAGADLPRDVQRSVSLYEQGRKLVDAGDCAKAIPLLEESIRYNESIGAHLSIAECRGDNALAAWREYKAAEALARRKEDDRAKYAHDHAAALERQLAMIRVTAPPKARAYLDEHPLEDPNDPVAIEPGAHRIEIVRADGSRVSKTVTAVAGHTARVTDEPEHREEKPAPPPPAPSTSDPGSGRRLTGVIVAGAGVGLAVAGGLFGLFASAKLSDAKDACAAYPRCAPGEDAKSARDANDAGRTDALLSTIGVGVGVAAIAVGAVLYFTAPKMISQGGLTARF